jgi:hypothetical protein
MKRERSGPRGSALRLLSPLSIRFSFLEGNQMMTRAIFALALITVPFWSSALAGASGDAGLKASRIIVGIGDSPEPIPPRR